MAKTKEFELARYSASLITSAVFPSPLRFEEIFQLSKGRRQRRRLSSRKGKQIVDDDELREQR
jgi:hypothetical protein